MIYSHPEIKHKYKLMCRPPLYQAQTLNENLTPSQTLRLTPDQYSSMLTRLKATGWSQDNGSTGVRVSSGGRK